MKMYSGGGQLKVGGDTSDGAADDMLTSNGSSETFTSCYFDKNVTLCTNVDAVERNAFPYIYVSCHWCE